MNGLDEELPRAELVGADWGPFPTGIWETWPREGQRLGRGHTAHGGLEGKTHPGAWLWGGQMRELREGGQPGRALPQGTPVPQDQGQAIWTAPTLSASGEKGLPAVDLLSMAGQRNPE